jgi:phosphoribosylanthranilate isomerase
MNKEQQELLDEVYKNYEKSIIQSHKENGLEGFEYLNKESFIERIGTDAEFSERWGLKIEERELSEDEGNEIRDMQYFKNNLHQALKGSDTKIDWENIPNKLITITYNDKTIESYE